MCSFAIFFTARIWLICVAKAKQFDLRDVVADYPDFPKPGILFRDINPVFKRNDALNHMADEFHRTYGRAKVDALQASSRGALS